MASLAILLVAAHMVGDYIAQTNWMAANKLTDWRVRTVHVLCYTACFVPVMLITPLTWQHRAGFLLLLFALHWVTDCRRWASDKPWAPKPILVDQTLHLCQIGVLAYAFGL